MSSFSDVVPVTARIAAHVAAVALVIAPAARFTTVVAITLLGGLGTARLLSFAMIVITIRTFLARERIRPKQEGDCGKGGNKEFFHGEVVMCW